MFLNPNFSKTIFLQLLILHLSKNNKPNLKVPSSKGDHFRILRHHKPQLVGIQLEIILNPSESLIDNFHVHIQPKSGRRNYSSNSNTGESFWFEVIYPMIQLVNVLFKDPGITCNKNVLF